MTTLYTHRSENVRKTWALMTLFFLLVMGVGWAASYYFGNPAILYLSVAGAIVMNITAYWNSASIALSSARAKEVPYAELPELHRIVENLAITAGLPKPKVYLIEDPQPNAFATGRDPEHSAIAVTSGLLAMLDRAELEGVLAHELSHIGNRDILVMTVAVVLVGILSVVADIAMRMSFWGGSGDRDRGTNPLLIIGAIAAIIVAPLAAQLMQLAISRRREFLADASGALLTRYPDGLASALQKIGSYQAPMRHASSATAHLFIANPFGKSSAGKFVANLFATHPPIEERVSALRGMRI